MEVLHAWVCNKYVGRFEQRGIGFAPTFVYSDDAALSLSLSLPQGDTPSDSAAHNFLDALLPESDAARDSIQAITGARSSGSWDLLSAIGGDLSGGVVLHPEIDGPAQTAPYLFAATESEIADRVAQIRRGGTGFTNKSIPPRFSLAGAQSKFALARTSFGDFWSDSSTPSTHILKPESKEHAGLELIEAATLDLANRAGVVSARAHQVDFAGASTFQIVRFDRIIDTEGGAQRIHAEDMMQALGVSGADKYLVGPDEIVELLRHTTGDDELGYAFYRQYAFNAIIGNADAHGKNYSLLYRDGGIELSPLYDAIPIGMFPDYEQSLAMPVGFDSHFLTVTPASWVDSAEDAGLDPERIRVIVQEVSDGVREYLDATVGAVDHARVTARGLAEIRESADRQVGDIPLRSAMPKTIDLAPAPAAPFRPASG